MHEVAAEPPDHGTGSTLQVFRLVACQRSSHSRHRRGEGSKNSQTTPATTSTSSIRQLLGAADTQTAHDAAFSTVPTRQLLGSANAETTPARAPAAAADRKQRPDAACEGKNG